MNENNIQQIHVDCLRPHPNNPRRDLGDLTDLANNIRERGVLQNLTVVSPKGIYDDWDDGYVVVIGHRRLAAAKLAGVEYVLCAIAEITPKEQISTMLLENIQRTDLTLVEQAHGFQMMLDMGDGYDDIAKATGISSATIRRRVKLLEYGEDAVAQGLERGARLEDFALLEELETEKGKKAALACIGTVNFRGEVMRQKLLEERKRNWTATLETLRSFAKEVDDEQKKEMTRDNGYIIERFFYMEDNLTNHQPLQDGKTYYFWHKDNHATLYQWAGTGEAVPPAELPSNTATSAASAEDAALQAQREAERAKREDCDRRGKLINEATKRARALRIDFIREKGVPTAQKNTVVAFAAKTMARYVVTSEMEVPDCAIMEALLGLELPGECEDDEAACCDAVYEIQNDYRKLLILAAGIAEENVEWGYGIYDKDLHAHFQPNARDYYDFLESIGYQTSDEERALVDGTHELFTPREQDGDSGGGNR